MKEDFLKAFTKPKPKLEIKKNKLKEIWKDFYNLRHKFSKKEVDKYRKVFYDIKNQASFWIRNRRNKKKF